MITLLWNIYGLRYYRIYKDYFGHKLFLTHIKFSFIKFKEFEFTISYSFNISAFRLTAQTFCSEFIFVSSLLCITSMKSLHNTRLKCEKNIESLQWLLKWRFPRFLFLQFNALFSRTQTFLIVNRNKTAFRPSPSACRFHLQLIKVSFIHSVLYMSISICYNVFIEQWICPTGNRIEF